MNKLFRSYIVNRVLYIHNLKVLVDILRIASSRIESLRSTTITISNSSFPPSEPLVCHCNCLELQLLG
jgi:hypothetical protein